MIDLIINDMVVDLSDSGISMLFQRQRTDYTNPTIVRNSFTKTIKLPGTKKNNLVFDKIWKLDKYITSDSTFIPSKRESFVLLKDGDLVEKGYVKLNNIIYDGDDYTYEVTLYGELGNLLYGLSYNINEVTQDVTPMTLADLTYDFSAFVINRNLVEMAWKRLEGDPDAQGDSYKIFDTLNFMVSYDGIPEANNFDTKKVWCSVNRYCPVVWREKLNTADRFPQAITVEDVYYTTVTTLRSRQDPGDVYGLLELKNDISVLEARDLRSYLLRPVINIRKIFEAIGDYIEDKYGYDLDMSDPYFNTPEFMNLWMTLSMLYEINPDVETGTVFTKEQILGNTSSPANYLISLCKTYGIYLDVDYMSKKLVLTRLPRFFDSSKINNLKIDLSKDIKINPLSFDKASYTFDYADGESEFIKKYKDTYNFKYGSRKVNTGYRFDASTAPYINNNIYRQGVDSIDQSIYYKYPYKSVDGYLFTYPGSLMDDANRPTYKLFDPDKLRDANEVSTIDGEMWALVPWVPGTTTTYGPLDLFGYQYINNWWAGIKEGVWQDGFPKLQCHSEGNKASDGKNILVTFNGFNQVSYGHINKGKDRTFWVNESYIDDVIDATKVNYLLSDDYPYLKNILGTNCYYDNPRPVPGFVNNYLTVINKLPSFTRSSYEYGQGSDNLPCFYVINFNSYNIAGNFNETGIAFVSKQSTYYTTTITTSSSSSGRWYSYFTKTFKTNHRYFLAASVKTSVASNIKSGNDYPYPDIIGSTKIDSRDLAITNDPQLIASIVETGNTVLNTVTSLSSSYRGVTSWDTYYLVVYDLTEMGLADRLTTVDAAINYFGMTPSIIGFSYNITDTLDFGIPQEIYVPATIPEKNIGIYNKYWSKYISDVYSVNTRVMECYCYLDNIDGVFREFYVYDNCLWILSKVTDWNMETKYCKATFIKVNDIINYIS